MVRTGVAARAMRSDFSSSRGKVSTVIMDSDADFRSRNSLAPEEAGTLARAEGLDQSQLRQRSDRREGNWGPSGRR